MNTFCLLKLVRSIVHHPQRDPHEVRDPAGEARVASHSYEGAYFSKHGKFQNFSEYKVIVTYLKSMGTVPSVSLKPYCLATSAVLMMRPLLAMMVSPDSAAR